MSLLAFLDRLADAPTFDKVIEPGRRAVHAVLPRPVRDLLHGTWLGHPLHPVMMHVPVGAWLSAGMLDLVPSLRPAGTVLIGAGVASAESSGPSHATPAARALTTDWIDLGPLDDLPERRPALRTGEGNGSAVPLVAVRRGSQVDVFVAACSHLSGPLHAGA